MVSGRLIEGCGGFVNMDVGICGNCRLMLIGASDSFLLHNGFCLCVNNVDAIQMGR